MDVSEKLRKKEITKHQLKGHRCLDCVWSRVSLANECLECIKPVIDQSRQLVDVNSVCSWWEQRNKESIFETSLVSALRLALGENFEERLTHSYNQIKSGVKSIQNWNK